MTENPSPAFPSLSIITVNLNLMHDTADCLHSLLKAGAAVEQLIVVDNGSVDTSVSFLREAFGHCLTILENEENLGYAHGVNRGIRHVLESCASDWILLMNNDTLVAEDFLLRLADIALQQKYKLLGPAIFYMDQPETIWSMGERTIPGTLIGYSFYRGKKLPPGFSNPFRVDFLNGCAMLIHRSVFEKIGHFDVSFFMYAEEVDFCQRAREAGYPMAIVPQAKMWHKVSASANIIRERTLYLRIRNQSYFYRRYSNILQTFIMALFSVARNSVVAFRYLIRGKYNLCLAVIRGWKDGWFNRLPDYRL